MKSIFMMNAPTRRLSFKAITLGFTAFFILCSLSVSATDDRFSWHPHFVEPQVVAQFIHGGFPDKEGFRQHLNDLYQRDVEEFELDADLALILSTGEAIASNGFKFADADDKWIEFQWIVVDYLFDYDQAFAQVTLAPAGEQSIWPDDFSAASTQESLFATLASESQRHQQMSCLADSQFGVCIYNYIYLSPQELSALEKAVANNSSTAYQDLARIVQQALSQKKGLLFIGLN